MSRERILVVDDSAEVRDFLANTLLHPEGYAVEVARSGKEGLDKVTSNPPDLVITDQAMPKMTGLEMISKMRARGLETPVILMTAEGSEEIASQAFRVGVSYYFVKPFDPIELQEAIETIFQGAREEERHDQDWGGDQAVALLAALDDALLVIDGEGRLRYANRAAVPFLKKPSVESLLGKKLFSTVKDQSLINILRSDKPSEEIEFPTGDGRTFVVRVKVLEGLGRIAILKDITAQKDIDEKRGEFVSTVAHDLRSPLTGILSYLELMSRFGDLTPQQQHFTEQMRQAVERMTDLLNDLLELSRIESEQEQYRERVPLRLIVERAADGLYDKAETKGQKLVIEGRDGNLVVEANPRRLYQVFTNLIENAIKYTPEGGTITINLASMAGQVTARVIDTGIGIPQKDIQHVFDKFYRVDEVASQYEGTGLGLSIVKSVIEAYNGRVWVESTPGKGSVFTIMLPALAA